MTEYRYGPKESHIGLRLMVLMEMLVTMTHGDLVNEVVSPKIESGHLITYMCKFDNPRPDTFPGILRQSSNFKVKDPW